MLLYRLLALLCGFLQPINQGALAHFPHIHIASAALLHGALAVVARFLCVRCVTGETVRVNNMLPQKRCFAVHVTLK